MTTTTKKYFKPHPLSDGHHKRMVPKLNKKGKLNKKANITLLENRYQGREPSVFISDGLSLQ